MQPHPRVLLVGLKASVVDYTKWPELSPAKLEAAFERVRSDLDAEGFHAVWCLTDSGETAEAEVADALQRERPDVVLVGAGVRTDPEHHLLFEKLINRIHREAPGAAIAFNTSPFDSVEAVRRWSPPPT